MKYLYIVGVVALVFLAFWFLRGGLFPKLQYKKALVVINDEEFLVDVADTSIKQAKGLSGRCELSSNEGMLFIFTPPTTRRFWMKDMKIPIDIIWIKDSRVVEVEKNVQPAPSTPFYRLQRYKSPGKVDQVLEILAGRTEKLGIEKGDEVRVGFK